MKKRYIFKTSGMLDGGEVEEYLSKHNLLESKQYSIPGIVGLMYSAYHITKPISYMRAMWIAFILGVKTANYGNVEVMIERS